jgi:hypothetical protein
MYVLPRAAGLLRLSIPAAFLAVTALIFPVGTALADQFLAARGGWRLYVNDRFGTRLEFPPNVFAPQPATNGDGRRFLSKDAALEVFAWPNTDGENALSMKNRLIGGDGYHHVTYNPSGSGWLVISGFRGDSIFYEKYFFRGGNVHAFGIEFPADRKPFYAPLVERMEDSFRAD